MCQKDRDKDEHKGISKKCVDTYELCIARWTVSMYRHSGVYAQSERVRNGEGQNGHPELCRVVSALDIVWILACFVRVATAETLSCVPSDMQQVHVKSDFPSGFGGRSCGRQKKEAEETSNNGL